MRKRYHVFALVAAGFAGCAVAVVGCRTADDGNERGTVAAITLAALPPVAPLAFFDRSCANCHGPFGMFYGEDFARKLDDEELRRVVGSMVRGPAQSALDPLSLDALVAFHRALRDPASGPFVVVTGVRGDEIRGEVSPGAEVNLTTGDAHTAAVVDGSQWLAVLPHTGERGSVVVSAQSSASTTVTTIDVSKQAYSHTATQAANTRH